MRISNYLPSLIYPDVPQISLDSYEEGLNLFIEHLLYDYSSGISIYKFGEIKTPGVSDIDLLIVTKDEDWIRLEERSRAIINSSGLLSFLFTHKPVVVGESLVSCLPALHTLENCVQIHGSRDPMAQVSTENQIEGTRIMRHVLWNSFIRIAALGMDNSAIGQRRALVLAHNLLNSAIYGNNLLSRPISIPLSTEEIRENVLSSQPQHQEPLLKSYIAQIVDTLNEVDSRLDIELESRTAYSPEPQSSILELGRQFIISPLTLDVSPNTPGRLSKRILKNVCVVLVPSYLVTLTSALANNIGSSHKVLAQFHMTSPPNNFSKTIDINPFAIRFAQAIAVSETSGVECFSDMPFDLHQTRPSLERQIIFGIRKKLLARQIRQSPPSSKRGRIDSAPSLNI